MAAYDLSNYDGVLAFGDIIRHLYLSRCWASKAWTWHEAADVRIFFPVGSTEPEGDLVWVGNWGDGERTSELHEFLLEPSRELELKTRIHGVRYPASALEILLQAGIEYAGWLPNYAVPRVFSCFKATVHIPRRPYVKALPGIPTIRPFEALACGIPLVCAPWNDTEGLFSPGKDFLTARSSKEMQQHLRALMHDAAMRAEFSEQGRRTILKRHTCAHRVNELFDIYAELKGNRQERSRQEGIIYEIRT
jgi:spore maturation protein CgeB